MDAEILGHLIKIIFVLFSSYSDRDVEVLGGRHEETGQCRTILAAAD